MTRFADGWHHSANLFLGLEQEFFLIPREAYYKRMDLQMTGRTVMGKLPARGQEMSDHYMASINRIALAMMQDVQNAAYCMGIPLRTRHREVAPNQYECAPMFGVAQSQVRSLRDCTCMQTQ